MAVSHWLLMMPFDYWWCRRPTAKHLSAPSWKERRRKYQLWHNLVIGPHIYIKRRWAWRMPSSICSTGPTLTWTTRAALWESRFLISPAPSTPFGHSCWETSWQRWEWTHSWWHGLRITSRRDHSTSNWRAARQTLWSAAPEHQMQKYLDDTAIVGCIKDGREGEYISLVEDFARWCRSNHLQLNTSKTKEMMVDFRRKKPHLQPVSIEGVDVEVVRTYKYLGLQLDDKLDLTANTLYTGKGRAVCTS